MPDTRMSLDNVRRVLISGVALEWQKHLGHAAGNITLDTAERRRLFEYLFSRQASDIEDPTDEIFDGLIRAWGAEGDPANSDAKLSLHPISADTWRLDKIRTYGFGGLNKFGGPQFVIDVNQETWCIEGQNGSGKTSLTSAIIWALTGQVIREHSGLTRSCEVRKNVYSNVGVKIGTWPPIAAYPTNELDLAKPAKVFVKLEFKNNKGGKAIVYRSLQSSSDGNKIDKEKISPAIALYTNLIEAGVVMPSRLGHLGFGERSDNLCEAVKTLTGLDFLETIGLGVAKIKYGGSRFLNFAKQSRIEDVKAEYIQWLDAAKRHVETTGFDLTPFYQLDKQNIANELEVIRVQADSAAKDKMAKLVNDLAANFDIGVQQGRDKVKQAVARVKIDITTNPIELSKMFDALASLTNIHDSGELNLIADGLVEADAELTKALQWHRKQEEDAKLRFKAEAAQWFNASPPQHCPLCEGELLSPGQKKLADELADLKINADAAKKILEDVCNGILKKITNLIPLTVQEKLPQLLVPDIKKALLGDLNNRFTSSTSFAILEGARKLLEKSIQDVWENLPSCPIQTPSGSPTDEPQYALDVRHKIAQLNQLLTIAEWWYDNKSAYWSFWKSVIGLHTPNGAELLFPDSVLGKHLEGLDQSLASAKPYDETALALKNAKEKVTKWQEINANQQIRVDIAQAITPLASLVSFVNAETSRTIDALSDRIGAVLTRIHLVERLEYKNTEFVRESARKSTVNVHGSLKGDFKIDATLVANASWLRSILWAFVFSLREEIVAAHGFNPFPLIVMDDPQATFDPNNVRLWATEIIRLSNSSEMDMAQFIVTTHETSFFKNLVQLINDDGRHGRLVGVTDAVGRAFIVDGTHITRLWNEANLNSDNQKAHFYILELRIYLENTLRYLLHGEGGAVREELLSKLIERIRKLSETGSYPFDKPPVVKLVNRLVSEKARIKKLQYFHHYNDSSFSDAKDIQENFWKGLSKLLHDAFILIADFRAFQGDHRQYPSADNIIEIPLKKNVEIRQLRMINTGIAAAAKSDGRAGDGLVELKELDGRPEIFLHDHDVFRLVAQTLEPVANIGDYLIVRNLRKVENRSLVVAGYKARLLARRYSELEDNPQTSVLSAQSIDPSGIADPILAPSKNINARMIVGTLFNRGKRIPRYSGNDEVIAMDDAAGYKALLENTRLFRVDGQSAEPIALNCQYLITGHEITSQLEMAKMQGCLVIAADTEGVRYFKRMRVFEKGKVILESLNADGFNPSIMASFDDSTGTQITSLLPVNGVLFELP